MQFPRLALVATVSTLALAACQQAETAKTTVQSAAQAQMTPTLSTADATFLNTIGPAGAAEVQAGQLAASKATSPAIRHFAQHMVDEHTAVNQKVAALAAQKQFNVAASPNTMQQDEYTQLQSLSGRRFNKTYLDGQVTAHQQVVQAFQDEVANGTDPDVKALAAQYLPHIQEHLTMAERLDHRG